MMRFGSAVPGVVVAVGLSIGLSAQPPAGARASVPPVHRAALAPVPATMPAEAQDRFVAANCATCHDDEAKTGGLSLEHFDASTIDQRAETAEQMIHKLRAGMMPPPIVTDRPAPATLAALATALEDRIDRAAVGHANPGRRMFQRLNRAEYARAIQDLLDVQADVTALLPADTMSAGFDNIADVQASSPLLIQSYLRAASRVAALGLGDRTASPSEASYKLSLAASQVHHVDGTPWGTRGGISVVHTFPADGDYTFRAELFASSGLLFGNIARGEQIEVSINGARVALLDISDRMSEADKSGMNLVTPRIHVSAGPQRISAAFIQRCDCPIDDLMSPIEFTLADPQIGEHGYGVTTLPHLRDFSITGPFAVTGVSETPSRRKIFTCRPTSAAEEAPCAKQILQRLATQAYREPTTSGDVEPLMKFYEQGRQAGGFEAGIRLGVQALLISPRFLFRLEETPKPVRPGDTYRISDLELASRISFFLWDAAPDAELLKMAASGGLRRPDGLDAQVRRMLADPRASALATRFAAQWLRLQDVDKVLPESTLYPSYNTLLAESFKRETELFFESIVREDRSVRDLLAADYTFVNERLARHYGIPNVTGAAFQRITLGPALAYRRGLLGQGSVLLLTSVADRTSPVQRGKWILEVLLGSPPPPPPPNVPALDDTKAVAAGGKLLSTRERMEEHRKNPACASCHRVIDPLGLSLENFDVTGQWRIKDNGVPVDATGTLYDGTTIDGPAGLRQALLGHAETFLRTFTTNLLAYALGRRVEYFDQPTVRATVRAAAAHNDQFSSFVLGIVHSPAFQMSRAAAPVRTTDAPTSRAGASSRR